MNTLSPPHFVWKIDANSVVGSVRTCDEDRVSFCEDQQASMAILADGVGGHNAGEVAAQFVCDALRDWFHTKGRNRDTHNH